MSAEVIGTTDVATSSLARRVDRAVRGPGGAGWVAAILLYPLCLTWFYFVFLSARPAPWPQLAFAVGKAVQFAPALLWLARVRPDLVRPRGRATGRDVAFGAAFGLAVAGALAALFVGWPVDVLGPAAHATFASAFGAKATALGLTTSTRFIVLALFYALVHSGLEEAYWRGLAYTAVRERVGPRAAVAVASTAFALHHVVLLVTLMPGQLPLALFLSVCVGVGGAAWCRQREAARSLLGAWLGHAIVDGAIFWVGWWVLFGGVG
ncbi:MAG: CPBP family intramembrane glutamic endopeptidase [Anaerolineae bacterium]